jgi:hypothetical protein
MPECAYSGQSIFHELAEALKPTEGVSFCSRATNTNFILMNIYSYKKWVKKR